MDVLHTLKSERDRLQKDLNKLNAAISALGGIASTVRTTASKRPALSAAGRARIAAAQRARWAKLRGQKKTAQKSNVVPMPAKKRTMSPAARRKIAAAQRARWAKVRGKNAAKAS